MHNNRIKQAPSQHSAIDNAGSEFCVRSAKAGEGRLLYQRSLPAIEMKLRSIQIPLLTLILFCSCQTKDVHKHKEIEVINDVFLEVVGTDYYLMPFPIPPFKPTHPDSLEDVFEMPLYLEDNDSLSYSANEAKYKAKLLIEYENFDLEKYLKDSLEYEEFIRNRPVDTANLVLIVYDSTILYPKADYFGKLLAESGFRSNFEVNASWRNIALKLLDSTNVPVALPLNKITNTGKYQLISEKEYKPTKHDRVVGVIRFSRVVFNAEGDKACFVYSIICGGECGKGYMVFVEKINNEWKLVEQSPLWVA